MTKDLAICALNNNNPPREKYVNTQHFIEKVNEYLTKKISKRITPKF